MHADDVELGHHMADEDVFEQACLFVVSSSDVSRLFKRKSPHSRATVKLNRPGFAGGP